MTTFCVVLLHEASTERKMNVIVHLQVVVAIQPESGEIII